MNWKKSLWDTYYLSFIYRPPNTPNTPYIPIIPIDSPLIPTPNANVLGIGVRADSLGILR